ncbi:MAG: helix-turn-helix transcriptional regulator [Gammaproteobacteria bacterium]|nr:helix-turn-helix transcriptional regulator [Gammaproteobacteria bacterium]
MHCQLKLNRNKLQIFREGIKRRVYVGELNYDEAQDKYELIYDKKYAYSKQAISLGPNLSLFQLQHVSEKGKLFPYFLDRIPDRDNPAYPDYCASQGIAVDEKNLIVLLGTIGRRGPSSFIFEAVYENQFSVVDLIQWRKQLDISQHDVGLAFDISKVTLQRIEDGKSVDHNTLKRLEVLFCFPEVARWQLKQSGGKLHRKALEKLLRHFKA